MTFLSSITFRSRRPSWAAAACFGLLSLSGCAGTNPIQPPPPPADLALACPTSFVLEATSPQGTDAQFNTPSATGGRAPYAIECNPGSGGTFAIGQTPVACRVVDADMKQAACGFIVMVRVSNVLSRTLFLAFGDSITAGKISLSPMLSLAEPETYPFKLEQMLGHRYPTQDLVVLNRGLSGERTDEGARRLPGVLDADKPEVLLLLEGVNAVWLLSTSRQADSIRSMIMAARARGVDVLVATVMPVAATWEADHQGSMSRIRALNTRIVQIAADLNIGPVVDLFGLFEANMALIGVDGLHPTAEGQTRIAEAFRDEIIKRYHTTASTMGAPFSTMKVAR
jgi:lysophospholipase L1-like esterase